jgi:hypothetical protein
MKIEIGNVDWAKLKNQKSILINMIQDWAQADDENQRNDAEEVKGIVHLIYCIQDYAVDKLGIEEKEVF